MLLFGLLALAALVNAGDRAHDKVVVEVETVHVIEYTEVCVCPTATVLPAPVPAITTLVCCDTCAPITVTSSAQPITSCTTAYTKTTTVCETAGVVLLGEKFYPCNSPPCAIEYEAPCPTCYVCPYSDCWVPNNIKPKHVTVYEYFGGYDREIARWVEDWKPWTWHETFVKTKWFPQPTIFIENNIEINITAPTSLTYTQTSTMTATETTTVTESITVPAPPSSVTPVPSSSPSAAPTTDLTFVLLSGSHAGYPVVVLDGKLAYGNVSNDVQTLRLSRSQLFDLNGHITYISRSDLTSEDQSYLYFVSPSTIPADGLTDVFSVDQDKNLVVTVDGVALLAVICNNEKFIRFGYSIGSCEAVVLAPESSVPEPISSAPSVAPSVHPFPSSPSSHPMSTPWFPSSTPESHVASVEPSRAPSAAPSAAPSEHPSVTPSLAPSVAPSLEPSMAPSLEPSMAPSLEPSEPPSSIPASVPISEPDVPSEAPSSAPPVRTFARLEATPQSNPIKQGTGSTLDADSTIIEVTTYDQFDDPWEEQRTFTIACIGGNFDYCSFRLMQEGVPITELTTNEFGTVQLYFDSTRSGTKSIKMWDAGIEVSSFSITVDAVVNCDNVDLSVSGNTNPLNSLIFGVDYPVLQAFVDDIFAFPMSGIDVTFGMTADITKRSMDPVTITTSEAGTAAYMIPIPAQAGVYQWTATPETCSALPFSTMYWFYDVDCDAKTVKIDPPTPYTDEILTISGIYSPTGGGGASLAGASVFLSYLTPDPIGQNILLGGDGQWSQNISYTDSTTTDWTVSLSVIGSKQPCVWESVIHWTVKTPACLGLSVDIMTASPLVPTISTTVTITIASVDSSGAAIPRVPYMGYSPSRGGMEAGSVTGVTDDTGHATIFYNNDGFGAQDEVVSVIFGYGTPQSCDTSIIIFWASD